MEEGRSETSGGWKCSISQSGWWLQSVCDMQVSTEVYIEDLGALNTSFLKKCLKGKVGQFNGQIVISPGTSLVAQW